MKPNLSKIKITYFVHGTTTDNEKNVRTGWHQGKLSALGKKQNLELKKLLKKRADKYDVIFSSDLKRALDSSQLVFGKKTKIIIDKNLRECNYGSLNGQSEKKFKSEMFYINHKHPKGECCKQVEKRIREFLNDISKKYTNKKIAIMAHKLPRLALEVICNHKTWPQALKQDWRKQNAWQPGWQYVYKFPKKMGFHRNVVPQVFAGKTKTYRLRNHGFKVGDIVEFENSQTKKIFGWGKIINIKKTKVGKINLQDKAHGAIYKKREELIKAFEKHHPDKKVTRNSTVFIYSYKFTPHKKT